MSKLSVVGFSLFIVGAIILTVGSLLYVKGELYLEDIKKGFACGLAGSSCPLPDFSEAIFYLIIGSVMLFSGIVIIVLWKKHPRNRT